MEKKKTVDLIYFSLGLPVVEIPAGEIVPEYKYRVGGKKANTREEYKSKEESQQAFQAIVSKATCYKLHQNPIRIILK